MGAVCCYGPKQKLDLLDAKRVEGLITHIKDPKLKAQLSSPEYAKTCKDTFAELDENKNGFLDGEELAAAVKKLVGTEFQERVKLQDITDIAKHFDVNKDGKISPEEFETFSKWTTVMLSLGFMGGASPFVNVKRDAEDDNIHSHLLIVSEGVDKNKKLCVNGDVQLVYFHPDSLTIDELAGQLDVLSSKLRRAFRTVALALSGPNDTGGWPLCAEAGVTKPSSGVQPEPTLKLLAEPLGRMIKTGGRLVFLLPNLGADEGVRKHLELLEALVAVDCAAEKDDDGNMIFGQKEESWNVTDVYLKPGSPTFKELRAAAISA